jgi:broad specificity phosphatase PhoE
MLYQRRMPSAWLCISLIAVILAAGTANADDVEADLAVRMQSGGYVLLIRHADAPGTGDPAGFRLDDCRTQRNLSGSGREQARSIGIWLRGQGVEHARVYSSEWCRCLETAELLGLGPVTPLPALNSFFQRPEDREPNLAALEQFLNAQPRDGSLIVLVTHQVTMTALTGVYPASGEGVLLRLEEPGALRPVGRFGFSR